MKQPIIHKLLLDLLHSLVNLWATALFFDFDSVRCKIDLLLSASFSVKWSILREIIFALVILLAATAEASSGHSLLLKNSKCSFWPIIWWEKGITRFPDAHIMNNFLGLGCHFVGWVFYNFSKAKDDWNYIDRYTHRHICLILRRRVSTELVFL